MHGGDKMENAESNKATYPNWFPGLIRIISTMKPTQEEPQHRD